MGEVERHTIFLCSKQPEPWRDKAICIKTVVTYSEPHRQMEHQAHARNTHWLLKSGEARNQQRGFPSRKYFIPGCVGRGLDLDLRVRPPAAPASGNVGFSKTYAFVCGI